MRGSRGCSNQENHHCLNGLIGKISNLIVSRRARCDERHPGHPGGTTEAAVGVWSYRAQETAAEGFYTQLWLHKALDIFYMI